MKLYEALELKSKHRNLAGHLVKDENIMISQIFIAPTDEEEFDKYMMHFVQKSFTVPDNFAAILETMDVEVFVLFYVKRSKSIQIMPLKEFISSISLHDLYSNLS